MLTEAEIAHGREWRPITIEEALELSRRLIIRCPKCTKRLCVHKARADGKSKAHFEHWPHTGGCRADGPVAADAEAEPG